MTKEVEMMLVPHSAGPDGPRRASEASAIELSDGRILCIYTHYCQSGHDYESSELRGLISKNKEGTEWGKPFMVQANDARLTTAIVHLVRLGTHGKRDLKTMQRGWSSDILKGTEGGAIGLFYYKGMSKYNNGIWFRLSRDEGRCWTKEVRINKIPTYDGLAFINDKAIVLSNGRIVVPVGCGPGGIGIVFIYYSDDEGVTWFRSDDELCIKQRVLKKDGTPGRVGIFATLSEPCVVELKDGRLLMVMRNITGRLWKSYSEDSGDTWSEAVPMDLSASSSPHALKRIPSTGDLLLIWNQVSREEINMNWARMRLSCAISKDEGETWQNFKNLESLDDTVYIEPEKLDKYFDVMGLISRHQETFKPGTQPPPDTKKYPRVNEGYWHVDSPSLTFTRDNRAVITYFAAADIPLEQTGLKLRILPAEWFYE